MCSLQRHDRLTNGVTITQALRCQVDTWLMGALREKSFGATATCVVTGSPWQLTIRLHAFLCNDSDFVLLLSSITPAGFAAAAAFHSTIPVDAMLVLWCSR